MRCVCFLVGLCVCGTVVMIRFGVRCNCVVIGLRLCCGNVVIAL